MATYTVILEDIGITFNVNAKTSYHAHTKAFHFLQAIFPKDLFIVGQNESRQVTVMKGVGCGPLVKVTNHIINPNTNSKAINTIKLAKTFK